MSKSATPAKRHKRSGTYDVEEEEEEEQVKTEKKEQDKEAETRKQQEEQEKAEKQKQEVELEQGAEKRIHEEKREEEEGEEKRGRKKRQRSSTFELSSSNDVTLPIDEKVSDVRVKLSFFIYYNQRCCVKSYL